MAGLLGVIALKAAVCHPDVAGGDIAYALVAGCVGFGGFLVFPTDFHDICPHDAVLLQIGIMFSPMLGISDEPRPAATTGVRGVCFLCHFRDRSLNDRSAVTAESPDPLFGLI